ncbi:NAD(P)/FAD-dependent oxidoreductase [Streptomyces populi]|uniref:NAD(P)/FAD-dependent oxidoreductase n=1 Tax=Streptomyces populi TaxID=2058924 RepID=UPI0019D2A638|nr:NAD(P)/FAD-dependent oxidoreductase [Streptomyces populi]
MSGRTPGTALLDGRLSAQEPGDEVLVIGGGFTGLAAAHELALAGVACRVLESEPYVGGLAGSFEVEGTRLERFYHHWFSSDLEVRRLCAELGCSHLLQEHRTQTGVYYANSVYRLSSPWDVLRFAPLPLPDRVRLGWSAVRARQVKHWRDLEELTAREWLLALSGPQVYDRVWRPLLEAKFGQYASEVGATWMWTKLHLRGGSRSHSGHEVLYYLHGGSAALLDAWVSRLSELGVRICTNTPVRQVLTDGHGVCGVRSDRAVLPARRVLATTAPGLLAGLLAPAGAGPPPHPDMPAVRRRLSAVPYLANLCLVLENDRPLSDTYWLNVTDPSFPYVGVIEHTNLEASDAYAGRHLVYLSAYLPTSAELYRMDDDAVFHASLPHLSRMFPQFRRDWVRRYHVWRADHAQPVITPHYSDRIPAMETDLPGLYLASMAQVYPQDRGTNYAVRQGRHAGRLIADRMRTARRTAPDPLLPGAGYGTGPQFGPEEGMA